LGFFVLDNKDDHLVPGEVVKLKVPRAILPATNNIADGAVVQINSTGLQGNVARILQRGYCAKLVIKAEDFGHISRNRRERHGGWF